jgi:hypothetical protein
MDKELADEIHQVLNSLVGLIYDLYPDEEYAELYGCKERIAQAQALADKVNTNLTTVRTKTTKDTLC